MGKDFGQRRDHCYRNCLPQTNFGQRNRIFAAKPGPESPFGPQFHVVRYIFHESSDQNLATKPSCRSNLVGSPNQDVPDKVTGDLSENHREN